MSVETYDAVARADDIARTWPDGREMPALIRDVADYVKRQQWLSLGATRMVGDRMDDYWIENGADLWPDFGIFMRLSEGSRVAQWFREGDTGEPPVVLIGSEGELKILSPTLEAFLAAWALAAFDAGGKLVARGRAANIEVELPSDLLRGDYEEEEGIPDGRPALASFLTERLGRDVRTALAPPPPSKPLETFFSQWGDAARAGFAANANLLAIARALDRHIPRGKQPWERVRMNVAAVDGRIEIGGPGDPRQPLPEPDAAVVRPLIAAEREARTKGRHAPRGLWHSADLLLYPDGACHIAADWEAEPKFWHGPAATAVEYAADLARYPRSVRWLEPWMAVR